MSGRTHELLAAGVVALMSGAHVAAQTSISVVPAVSPAIEPLQVEVAQAALDDRVRAERRQAMPYSISTLLNRNLHDVFGENDPARRRAAIDEILTPTFDISRLPSRRSWAMAGGSDGYLAAPVRRPLTPGLISSLSGTAGLPPSTSFSTSYPELDSAVRHPMPRIVNDGDEYFEVVQVRATSGTWRCSVEHSAGTCRELSHRVVTRLQRHRREARIASGR